MSYQLPHVLSELAQVALDDIAKTPALGLGIRMTSWCNKRACTVCAAGAVMVSRLGMPFADGEHCGHRWMLDRFGLHNTLALAAIDCLREGNVGFAIATMETQSLDTWVNDDEGDDLHALARPMPVEFGDEWLAEMRRLVTDLREANL